MAWPEGQTPTQEEMLGDYTAVESGDLDDLSADDVAQLQTVRARLGTQERIFLDIPPRVCYTVPQLNIEIGVPSRPDAMGSKGEAGAT